MYFEKKAALILLCLILFQSSVSFYVLGKSRLVRSGPDQVHILQAIQSYQLLTSGEGRVPDRFIESALKMNLHPQLYPLSLGVMLSFLAQVGLKSVDLALLLTNTAFLLVLLLSTYIIGSLLYDKKVGLLAAVLLSFSPMIFGTSRIALIDFSLAAFVALTFLFLLKTRHFDSFPYSFLTGIAFAVALLTKETAAVFILPLFLYYAGVSLLQNGRSRRKTATGIIIALLCLVPVAMFYFFNREVFLEYWHHVSFKNDATGNPVFYLKCFFRYYFGVVFCVLSLPLVISYIVNLKKRNAFLILWFLISFLVFSVSNFRYPRFLIPCLPAVFLILSAELFTPWFSRIKKAYVFILVAAIFSQYIYFNFLPSAWDKNRLPYESEGCGLPAISRDDEIKVVEGLSQFFQNESRASKRPLKIIFLFSQQVHYGLIYDLRIKNIPASIISLPQMIFYLLSHSEVDWNEYLMRADFLVDRTSRLEQGEYFGSLLEACKVSLNDCLRHFKEVLAFKTASGDTIYIYRKNTPSLPGGLAFSYLGCD